MRLSRRRVQKRRRRRSLKTCGRSGRSLEGLVLGIEEEEEEEDEAEEDEGEEEEGRQLQCTRRKRPQRVH
jgi:hypothetical protein